MKIQIKFTLWCAALVLLVVTFGAISISTLSAQYRAARAAAAEYSAMDRAAAAADKTGWFRDALSGPDALTYRDVRYFDPIKAELADMLADLKSAAASPTVDHGDAKNELDLGQRAATHVAAAESALSGADSPTGQPPATRAELARTAASLERARADLASVAKLVPGSARRQIEGAADRLFGRLQWTCLWLLVVLGLSTAIHFKQYRLLVRPLVWLRDDMKVSAAHEYRTEVRPRGESEFRDIAARFNGLASDLAKLYQSLEDKVIARSRELVRSERLASVGFLAAGVAHEINNPLSVISGYAELAGKNLRTVMTGEVEDEDVAAEESDGHAEAEAQSLASALEAQEIIREEAFRCKEITGRLLSLARGGEGGRQPLRLDEVARQIATLTRGLKNYRDRRVLVQFPAAEALDVSANLTELKQVLLNLTVNALEAVPADRGVVTIGGRRDGDWAEVYVEDNGKGMPPHVLEQIFEPFFTAKRGAGEPGTGLGLSITHAIVENHGGRITATSPGAGKGSRFTVRLPLRKMNNSNITSPAVASLA